MTGVGRREPLGLWPRYPGAAGNWWFVPLELRKCFPLFGLPAGSASGDPGIWPASFDPTWGRRAAWTLQLRES